MTRRISAGVFAAVLLLASYAQAQPQTAPAKAPAAGDLPTPAEPNAIPLLKSPDRTAAPEQWMAWGSSQGRAVRNVTNPTLTPVLPDPSKATGAAVIIAPGGGFFFLTMDNEGYAVARWLADRGVAAFVLKYRTEVTPRDRNGFGAAMGARMRSATADKPIETPAAAIADGQAAVRLVRARAAEWGVDPARVGFLGFSAGAMTALSVGLADDKAARPDFIAPIYPPMNARTVPADAPPMFVAIALDDPLFAKGKHLGLIDSWRTAGRPVEAHLYGQGGHGFGMDSSSAAARMWIDQFYAWMQDRRLLKPKP